MPTLGVNGVDVNIFTFEEHFSPEVSRQQQQFLNEDNPKITSTLALKIDAVDREERTVMYESNASGTLTHKFEVKVATSLRKRTEKENNKPLLAMNSLDMADTVKHAHGNNDDYFEAFADITTLDKRQFCH